MMKYFSPLFLLPFYLLAQPTKTQTQELYKTGFNTGRNTLERMDRVDKYMEGVSKRLMKLESENKLYSEQIKLLRTELQSIKTQLDQKKENIKK